MLKPLFSKGFVIRVKNNRLANEYETQNAGLFLCL